VKWFKHDATARMDSRISKLRMKYGVEGYGLYFYCLEVIAGEITSSKYTFELEHDSELLAHELKMDTLKVEEILKWCTTEGLFEYNTDNNRITCFKMLKRLDDSTSKNIEIRKLIDNAHTLIDIPKKSELVGKTSDRIEENRIEEKRKEEITIEENNGETPNPLTEYPSLNIPSFIGTWNEWVIYRKQKKQTLTPISLKRQLNLLSKDPDNAEKILERSMLNGWTGLFALDKKAAVSEDVEVEWSTLVGKV